MEIVDRMPISQDKSVLILKVEKNYYLLSLSQSGIGLIKELENVDEQTFQNMDEDQSKNEYNFKDVFSQYFANKNK